VIALAACTACAGALADSGEATATPIKHVIVLIGENRTFDNVFGTYTPHRQGQTVANLLSRGIVGPDGQPGPNSSLARQFTVNTIPPSYFIQVDPSNKSAYALLPRPNTSYIPAVGATLPQVTLDPADTAAPFNASTFSPQQFRAISPVLPLGALPLLTTGATGLAICNVSPTKTYPNYPPQGCFEDDSRVANFAQLPNSVFPLRGPALPYDSYTGDMVHRFFHMWQQSDCDAHAASISDPAGCRNDLYPFVGVARNDGSGGNAMGFYNVQTGDAPILKRLADQYTMSDNFHQSVMGGTFVQHMMLGTADAMTWESYRNGQGVTLTQPPTGVVANPDPKSPTDAAFKADKAWTACGDLAQPGVRAIHDYLASLPWHPDRTATNCDPSRFYLVNNVGPGFKANGDIDDAAITAGALVPPSSLRNIGDALNEKGVSWAYYGGGYNAAVRAANGSTDPIDLLIGTNSDFYCNICNPFQYSKSIMGDPAQRHAHIGDALDFFALLERGELPAVAYVKPDSFTDGHPASSKLDLFEALVERIHDQLQAHPALFEETAFFVVFDEGGGYWDSGSFQPLDFFGDGPRIPFIVVSPHARGGRVVHTYTDHVSIVKFIERNWRLKPLTARSRDNLPNPHMSGANPYVPQNMPAIGDLFDMFHFDGN
jgi:phospholipase C